MACFVSLSKSLRAGQFLCSRKISYVFVYVEQRNSSSSSSEDVYGTLWICCILSIVEPNKTLLHACFQDERDSKNIISNIYQL